MNSFGRIFRISIYGESHGNQVGVMIDGCPAGLAISEDDFTEDVLRRKSGAKGTTPRIEDDKPILVSGVFNGFTTGTPILISFHNKNTKSNDYKDLFSSPRPGHADFTAKMKYGGFNDYCGGGHFSGRLTLGLVAAGVIAKKLIKPVSVNAKLVEAGGEPDIEKAIDNVIKNEDSIGGVVECKAENISVLAARYWVRNPPYEAPIAPTLFGSTKGCDLRKSLVAAITSSEVVFPQSLT